MINRVWAHQVPAVWEIIKYAVSNTNALKESSRQKYFNHLLISLLNDKSQCFVVSENQILKTLILTSVNFDLVEGVKTLSIDSFYSFERLSNEQILKDFEYIRKFAQTTGCKYIVTKSSISRVYELANLVGLRENSRTFVMEI